MFEKIFEKFIYPTVVLVMLFMWFLIILFLFKFFASQPVFGNHLPGYKGFVNDYANVIEDKVEDELEFRLRRYEEGTTNELAILTVQTTQPDDIEQYAIHLAEQWKVGKEGKDNGVILLVAVDDRKMRIEAGRGLEGDLTDLEAKHIIDGQITPDFKRGAYTEGVVAGIDGIITALATESAVATATGNAIAVNGWVIILAILVGVLCLAFSPYTPLGGEGDGRLRGLWVPKQGSKWGKRSIGTINRSFDIPIVPPIIGGGYSSGDDDDDDSGSGWGSIGIGGGSFGGFGGGSFSGGGASGSW